MSGLWSKFVLSWESSCLERCCWEMGKSAMQEAFQVTKSPPSMKFTICLPKCLQKGLVFSCILHLLSCILDMLGWVVFYNAIHIHVSRYSNRSQMRNAVRRKLTVDGKSEKEIMKLNLHLHFAVWVTSPPPINVSSKFTILCGAAPSGQFKVFAKSKPIKWNNCIHKVSSCWPISEGWNQFYCQQCICWYCYIIALPHYGPEK